MSQTARDVLAARLAMLVERLRACEADVRRGAPDSVHQMRVTSRRVSGCLATFRSLWDTDIRPVRDEVKTLGHILGAARDAEVLRERLSTLRRPDEAGDARHQAAADRAWTRIESHLQDEEQRALSQVLQALDSERYQGLLSQLDALSTKGPWSTESERSAHKALRPFVRSDWKRVRRRAKTARGAATAAEHGPLLHAVRKAARRARYAGEAVEPVFGKDAADFTARAERIQELLGELHDSLISQQRIRDLAASNIAPDTVLVYGRLLVAEEGNSARAERQWDELWAQTKGRSTTRWLTG